MRTSVELVIPPRTASIGVSSVRRTLPYSKRRMVGPFIFLDRMGPEEIRAGTHGEGDVKPHPHIGLSTVTYLFQGEIHHRDSIGSSQIICPGDVNWMTSGKGIAHSERMTEQTRSQGGSLNGVQIWVALPREFEETAPDFKHYASSRLPVGQESGASFKIIAGSAFGLQSPVATHSPLFYVEMDLPAGKRVLLPKLGPEMGVYAARGDVQVQGVSAPECSMAVLGGGDDFEVFSETGSKILLLGGEPMDGSRLIWWNFVSSSADRLAQAREDWISGRFQKVPGDEIEFVPAPEYRIPQGIR